MNTGPTFVVRLLVALLVVLVSLVAAIAFASLVSSNSVSDVASRNGLVAFLIIFIPLLYIGFKLSQRVLK